MAGLRKREGAIPDATGAAPKRLCRREPGRSSQPSIALPEAAPVEEDQGGESPPIGVPIGGSPQSRQLVPVPPSAEATEEPPRGESPAAAEQRDESASEAGIATSPEVIEISPPAPQPPRKAEALPPSDAPRSPPSQSSQPSLRTTSYQSQLSETVLKLSILPKFQALLRSLPTEESFDTLFTAALQMSNGLFIIRDDLASAKSRIEGLDREISDAKARESKALDDLRVVQGESRM